MTEIDLNWLEEVIKTRNGKDIARLLLPLDVVPAVPYGENFISDIYRINFKILLKCGKEVKKSIILKRKVDINLDDKLMEKNLSDIFNKEYEVYTNILSNVGKYLPKNIDQLWAECLGTIPNKDIYFDDLKASGYGLANRLEGLDLDHCLLVFRSLAEFHAASYIAISKGEIDTASYRKYLVSTTASEEKIVEVDEFDIMLDVIRNEWGPQWKSVADKLERFMANRTEIMKNVGEIDETGINVFNHGDTWTNNFMFKKDLTGKPVSFKFVDFQISHYNSFAFDICYLLTTSINPDLKKQNLNTWIETYCQTFSQCMEEHGCQLPSPTPCMVRQELNRLAPFSLVVSIRLRPIFLVPPDDFLPIAELLKDTGINSKKRRLFTNFTFTEFQKKDISDTLSILKV